MTKLSAAINRGPVIKPAKDDVLTGLCVERRVKQSVSHSLLQLKVAGLVYADSSVWSKLGATSKLPRIPADVISHAYSSGGRIIYHPPTSINEQVDLLKNKVSFHYDGYDHFADEAWLNTHPSKSGWLVVPALIDRTTLGKRFRNVVNLEHPAPTSGAWFAMLAYAVLTNLKLPDSDGLFAFTRHENLTPLIGRTGNRIYVRVFPSDARLGMGLGGSARYNREWHHRES